MLDESSMRREVFGVVDNKHDTNRNRATGRDHIPSNVVTRPSTSSKGVLDLQSKRLGRFIKNQALDSNWSLWNCRSGGRVQEVDQFPLLLVREMAQPYALLDGSHYEGTRDHYRRGYGSQAIYALEEVGRVFSVLRARWAATSRPLVLIVQGDHGSGMNYDVGDIRRTDVSERLTILLGISWPGVPAARVPVVDSPVNIYRAVFSEYFGAKLPMLPDRSYMTTFEHPYKLVLVDPSRPGDGLPASGRTSGPK